MKTAALALGAAVVVGAQVAPLDGRFSTHMLQHLLLGDLGPLLLVLGLPPRAPARASPLLALPLWTAALVAWHLSVLYDAALRHGSLHAFQHATFFVAGLLLWLALLRPGPAWFTIPWRLAYVLAMWAVSLALSQVFLWSGRSYYAGYSLNDQRTGGGVMLIEGSFVMLGVVVWLLLTALRETER
jgi:putative membrane protein